jgi:hypothetical protein
MAGSGRTRHRDRQPAWRQPEEPPPVAGDAVFKLTEAQRQQIARSLRYIDEARRAIEDQRNPANREIIRELRASADRIFDLINSLEEIDRTP